MSVYDASGNVRFRFELPGVIDIAPVGNELWAIAGDQLVRRSALDGKPIASESIGYLDRGGRFMISATAAIPVWHAARPVVVRANPARVESIGPGGDVMLPIAEGRWLLWQAGQLRLWRSIGEAWRKPLGDQGMRVVDAQLVLEGRLFVLAQQRAAAAGEPAAEMRLSVAAVSDGSPHAVLRVPAVEQVAFAARRGLAAARSGERLAVVDLRFGRWLRDLMLPAETTAIAIDDALQLIAIAGPDGVDLVRPDALGQPSLAPSEASEAEAAHDDDAPQVDPSEPPIVFEEPAPTNGHSVEPPPAPAPERPAPFPEAPLVRLDPVAVVPDATAGEIAQTVELQLQLVGAQVYVAIAEAWDSGRIVKPDQTKPPFVDEVAGLLKIVSGKATGELERAQARLEATREVLASVAQERGSRLTPLDVLARDFELSPLAMSLLFLIAAPRMRGELARLYGILANDQGRSVVDEFLLTQILGGHLAGEISRELDADRPLRRYGLVRLGPGDRPFAPLAADTLVVRNIMNQPAEGEPDQNLEVRRVDRDLEELQLPRAVITKALRFLSTPRPGEPARIVVRGRTGSGRHTLLTSLAARAGRSLGIIDLSIVPREPGRLVAVLETALRRAMLRGVVPCIDGLELIGSDERDLQIQVGSVLRGHPGPVAVRLPQDASAPLDPGYLTLDLPIRNERERSESWAIALERHGIPLPDPSDLASRYRVGPGTIERVCIEVTRRADPPTDPAGWLRELDEAVRQHLENRLGKSATRVSRLATWTDVVLPEDIVDSLLELTARVRHRKKVFEQWGFDKSITTARGITALFQGSPGTGKTMVAGVIARDLGLELYRVDVSRITSKWIGETEKNLGALFDAAEDGQVMLLFDEADSLFAKRTEVKTSVDRYSNMEVNYLLQRLDSFEGIAILTTNFGNAIDPAFKRRLTYRVTFPFPDEEMREQLWRSLIPSNVPVQGTLDFATLAQRFRLSGGYIRNAALRAAFLAAEEGGALQHEHLERAIRMEFREIGKLAETGTLE
ncbi:MAG: ATP-binding protein [Deltaproteobacteria bacterium]|nr:ATP-binding protein [Deltaproteobacteria bacterium]